MKVLAIIPARSGSKGIPGKNMINLCGKALVRWSIDQAVASNMCDRIIVSTDSAEYKQKLDLWYPDLNLCPYLQPPKISRDNVKSNVYLMWVLDWVEKNLKEKYDTVMLLEPTSPLRFGGTIAEALDLFAEKRAKALISVCESHRCHPAISFELGEKNLRCLIQDTPHFHRQEMRPFYHPSGTIYIANIDWYKKHETFITGDTIGYKIKPVQDYEIDEPHDLKVVSALMDEIR